jgi:hypothetical protein
MRVDKERQNPPVSLMLTLHPLTVANAIHEPDPGGWHSTILSANVLMGRPALASTFRIASSASCDEDL